jgi:hypothetical protein
LTLYFSDRDFENYNDRIQNKGFKKLPEPGSDDFVNNLLIWQWHGTSDTRTPGSYTKNGTLSTGKFIKPNSSDIVYNEELRRWEIKFHFTGFSGFFVTTPEEGALPVTLTSFAVSAQSQEQHRTAALLTWSTAEETNSKNFEIQSSANGLVIGLVEAQEKSSIETRYSFTDTAPGHGTNFYRLRMIDRDGTFAYSSIRSLRVPFDIVIYPNPVNDWLHIDIESRQAVQQVTIFDVVGREVGRHPYVPEVPLSVKDLSPGIYFVELLGENGYLERRKIVVARP